MINGGHYNNTMNIELCYGKKLYFDMMYGRNYADIMLHFLVFNKTGLTDFTNILLKYSALQKPSIKHSVSKNCNQFDAATTSFLDKLKTYDYNATRKTQCV